jgi:hypothetical protein
MHSSVDVNRVVSAVIPVLPQQRGRFVVRGFVGVVRRPVAGSEAERFFGVLAESFHIPAVLRQLGEDEVGIPLTEPAYHPGMSSDERRLQQHQALDCRST